MAQIRDRFLSYNGTSFEEDNMASWTSGWNQTQVCPCALMCACVSVCTDVCMRVCVRFCVHACLCAHVSVYVYVRLRV